MISILRVKPTQQYCCKYEFIYNGKVVHETHIPLPMLKKRGEYRVLLPIARQVRREVL